MSTVCKAIYENFFTFHIEYKKEKKTHTRNMMTIWFRDIKKKMRIRKNKNELSPLHPFTIVTKLLICLTTLTSVNRQGVFVVPYFYMFISDNNIYGICVKKCSEKCVMDWHNRKDLSTKIYRNLIVLLLYLICVHIQIMCIIIYIEQYTHDTPYTMFILLYTFVLYYALVQIVVKPDAIPFIALIHILY